MTTVDPRMKKRKYHIVTDHFCQSGVYIKGIKLSRHIQWFVCLLLVNSANFTCNLLMSPPHSLYMIICHLFPPNLQRLGLYLVEFYPLVCDENNLIPVCPAKAQHACIFSLKKDTQDAHAVQVTTNNNYVNLIFSLWRNDTIPCTHERIQCVENQE